MVLHYSYFPTEGGGKRQLQASEGIGSLGDSQHQPFVKQRLEVALAPSISHCAALPRPLVGFCDVFELGDNGLVVQRTPPPISEMYGRSRMPPMAAIFPIDQRGRIVPP
jgi:hypothetical protein